MGKIKVLVVDDSFLMRKMLADIINSDPGLEVIDKADNGRDAVNKILALKPDVVTLDVNLPLLDGLSVLAEVMRKQPTRTIMISAHTRKGADTTIKALELGALDFILKPSGEISLDIPKLKEEIISKIKMISVVEMDKFLASLRSAGSSVALSHKPGRAEAIKKLVVIGASTGGPKAILNIMQQVPRDIAAGFLIVQHMPKGFTASFAERLSWESEIRTKEAVEGDIILPGRAFVAPAGYHALVERHAERFLRIRLSEEPLVNFVRPAVDVSMVSAADIFGKDVIGVVLTGMGKDGLAGARQIKEKGGVVIVQDEATSVIWGMPKMVYEAGIADKVVPLSGIAQAITEEVER